MTRSTRKGGVCGRKLHLQFEHASSPAESIAAVKKLVEQDKVFVLVLASGSTGAAAAADYVREVGVPTYNLYGSTPIIRNPFSKNVFNGAVVPVEVSAAALISMFYDGGYTPRKFGILAGTYAFPQATLKAAEDILKQKKADYTVEQFDLAPATSPRNSFPCRVRRSIPFWCWAAFPKPALPSNRPGKWDWSMCAGCSTVPRSPPPSFRSSATPTACAATTMRRPFPARRRPAREFDERACKNISVRCRRGAPTSTT